MRVGEVDIRPGGTFDPLVVEQLVALVPGQGASKRRREGTMNASPTHSAVQPSGDRDQDGVSCFAFNEGGDGHVSPSAEQQVSFQWPIWRQVVTMPGGSWMHFVFVDCLSALSRVRPRPRRCR